MLSVQLAESAATAASDYEYRPDHFANDLTLFKQPCLGVSLDGLLDEIRYRKDFSDFEQNRSGIASIILLAHNMGLVSEQEIDQCVTDGWRAIYSMYRSAIKSIINYLGNEAGMIAGKDLKHNNYESLHMFLNRDHDGAYIYISVGMRFSEFSLMDLDLELRQMIYSCLNWVVNVLGFGILADDFVGASMMVDEEMDDYKKYKEMYPALNNDELAVLLFDSEEESIFMEYAEDPEYLVERFGFLEWIIENSVESSFGTVLSMNEIRATVVRWRRSNNENFNSPWVGFIRQTIQAWKWFRTCSVANGDLLWKDCGHEYEDACAPLNYSHFVGLGLPWESSIVEDIANNIFEAGEVPMAKLKLKVNELTKVAETLIMLAKARGLIRLAEVTNFGEEDK